MEHDQPAQRRRIACGAVWLFVLCVTARCAKTTGPADLSPEAATLRVGVGHLALADPIAGVRQLVGILSTEALVNFNEDGRPRPWLAEGWTVAADGRSLTVRLRPGVTFHDGSPLAASTVVDILRQTLPVSMGPAYQTVASIAAPDDARLEITLRQPAPFLVEALEAPIRKPGASGVGTGPFKPEPTSTGAPTEMVANSAYYLGPPPIARITMKTYPSIRAAWADMLRGQLDMLHEVGSDALDSLQSSTNVSVHTITRHYQYVVVLNSAKVTLKSARVRRALNLAIDRAAVIRDGLNGYGVESTGPVWAGHWAFTDQAPTFRLDQKAAAQELSAAAGSKKGAPPKVRFTCLVPSELTYERLALVVKRQLESVGIEMVLEQTSPDRIPEALARRSFDAVLIDVISGPSVFRPYQFWHSKGAQNPSGFSSSIVDAALDRIYHSTDDTQYRNGVTEFQRAIVDDPPAIFLAWGKRARAVSRRFAVPDEPDRDIITTIRQWRPTAEMDTASRN